MDELADLVGVEVGPHSVEIDDHLAILYALAVGASEPELVWERDLRVLPTLATAVGLWAVEEIGDSATTTDPGRSMSSIA